jgi:hypothetical protein
MGLGSTHRTLEANKTNDKIVRHRLNNRAGYISRFLKGIFDNESLERPRNKYKYYSYT